MKFTFETIDPSELVQMQLRESDILEMKATSGLAPKEGLLKAVEVSDWWRAIKDEKGQVLAVFGVSQIPGVLSGTGSPWFLATDAAMQYRIHFFRLARKWLDRMQEEYPVLVNFVDARHKEALDWVAWLGFEFVQTTSTGLNGETLIQIIRTRPCADPQQWQA